MARPSVAAERRKQILDAVLQTMAEHGVSGTTLDRIAATAGMARGHVRHFAGNRDEIFLDTARTLFGEDEEQPPVLPADATSFREALDFLFGSEFTASDAENAVVMGFVELSRTNTEIAAVLAKAYSRTREQLYDMLTAEYPDSEEDTRRLVADTAMSSSLGNVFMGDFDQDPGRTRRVRQGVEELLTLLR